MQLSSFLKPPRHFVRIVHCDPNLKKWEAIESEFIKESTGFVHLSCGVYARKNIRHFEVIGEVDTIEAASGEVGRIDDPASIEVDGADCIDY